LRLIAYIHVKAGTALLAARELHLRGYDKNRTTSENVFKPVHD
jgi:hypothetical protein